MALDLRNMDCMELMKQFPDKHFDLAIVDPPYGINIGNAQLGKGGGVAKSGNYTKKNWDKDIPKADYFKELFRVSKEQIVWGGNYFLDLWQTPCKGFIFWDKQSAAPSFADGEFAWTSFDVPAKCFRYKWAGMIQEKMNDKEVRIHPTQKPSDLYRWILKNFAKEGDKILDTHLGSGSIAIACHDYKFDLTASEIDTEYFNETLKRVQNHVAQQSLF